MNEIRRTFTLGDPHNPPSALRFLGGGIGGGAAAAAAAGASSRGPSAIGGGGSGPPGMSEGGGGGRSMSTSAQSSHSSIVDPVALQSQWRVPSLLDLCSDGLAAVVTQVPRRAVDELPVELLELLTQSLSKNRQWNKEAVDHLLPLLDDVDQLSLSQFESLRGDLFTEICSQLKRPLLAVDLSRSYHLVEFDGALKANLSACKKLDLDRCRRLTSQELLPILQACPQLEILKLSGTRVEVGTLFTLNTGKWKNLTELDISSWYMNEGFDKLCQAGLPLQDLKVTGTNFKSDALAQVSHLKSSLHTLHVQFNTHIRNSAMEGIGECTKLTELDCSRNSNLGDEGFAFLPNLTQLRTLNLSRTDLTPASNPILCRFTKMTHLDISYNSEVTDEVVLAICPSLTKLRILILAYCNLSDQSVVEGIVPHCKEIQVLKLNGCTRVGDDSLACLAEKAAMLPEEFKVDEEAQVQQTKKAASELQMTEDAKELLTEAYVQLRQLTAPKADDAPNPSVPRLSMSVRTLESLIRISTALAKSKFDSHVKFEHVEAAVGHLRNAIEQNAEWSEDLATQQLTGSISSTSSSSSLPFNSEVDPTDVSPTVHALDERIKSSSPQYTFPHSLLCFDFGSTKVGDPSIDSLGILLHHLPWLQRVGIWNSNMNTFRLKRLLKSWIDCADQASGVHKPKPADAVSGESKEQEEAAEAVEEAESTLQPPRPYPIPYISEWQLDESMKTTSGTFLFVRRALLEGNQAESALKKGPTPKSNPFLYGLDEYAKKVQQRKRKSVHFTENALSTLIPIPALTPANAAEAEVEAESVEQVTPAVSDASAQEEVPIVAFGRHAPSSPRKTHSSDEANQ